MSNFTPEDHAKIAKAAAIRHDNEDAGTTRSVEFSRIEGKVRYDGKRGGYQVLIVYSHPDHEETKTEASQRLFHTPREAEAIATQVVQDLRAAMS